MKILDATAVIAFLSEMKCPEAIIELSKRTKIIVPEGVAHEIVRPPGKETLLDLAKRGIVEIVKVDQATVCRILDEYPQLHRGECEAIALVQEHVGERHVVSDDSRARKIFQTLNFMWTEELLDTMRKAGTISEDIYKIKHQRLQNSAFYSRRKP